MALRGGMTLRSFQIRFPVALPTFEHVLSGQWKVRAILNSVTEGTLIRTGKAS